jgi:hypothetical protein
VPTLQVIPTGEPISGGDYEPVERHRPAVIGILTNVLMDEDKARQVLWPLYGQGSQELWEHADVDVVLEADPKATGRDSEDKT